MTLLFFLKGHFTQFVSAKDTSKDSCELFHGKSSGRFGIFDENESSVKERGWGIWFPMFSAGSHKAKQQGNRRQSTDQCTLSKLKVQESDIMFSLYRGYKLMILNSVTLYSRVLDFTHTSPSTIKWKDIPVNSNLCQLD